MNEEKILQPEQNYGPGNVLRAKREEYEWSVDAVAEALHLSTAAVKSIEADRYEDLPGATYVMGYWRSYARLLGIDIEDTIEANKRNLNVVTAEASGMDVIRPVYGKKGSGGVIWFLVLLILGGFGYYAWQQNFFGVQDIFQTPPDTQTKKIQSFEESELPKVVSKKDQMLRPLAPAETASVVTSSATEPVPNKDFSQAPVANTVATVLTSSEQASTPDPADPVTTEVRAAEDAPVVQTGLVLSSGSAVTAKPVAAEALQEQKGSFDASVPDTASAQSVTASQVDNTVSGDSELVLTVTRKNWVDVRDKGNNRLESRAGAVGDVIKVKGIPPFYVRVTPPDSVKVRYNGKSFPLPAKNNGLSASFKLDKTIQPL